MDLLDPAVPDIQIHELLEYRRLGSHIRLTVHEFPFLLIPTVLRHLPYRICSSILRYILHLPDEPAECVHESAALDRQLHLLPRLHHPSVLHL